MTPYPNPFDVSAAYAPLMRAALALALLPGLGLGLLLATIAGLGLRVDLAWPALAQGHGQVQTLGFTLLFVVAVGLQLLPRFLGTPMTATGRNRAVIGGLLAGVGVLARLVSQPMESGPLRTGLLILAAVAVLGGVLAAASGFHTPRQQGAIRVVDGMGRGWSRFVAVGGLALGTALILHTWALFGLASGWRMVPNGLNEALIHLEIAGFATCMVVGVGSRVFGRFLLLRTRPAFEARLPHLAGLYGLGLILVAGGWLMDIGAVRLVGAALGLGVVLVWLWLVGLFNSPSRLSGMPHVTGPTRRWVRLAFVFLLAGNVIGTGLEVQELVFGIPAGASARSAARHSLAQGFLLVMMVAMAARLLPIYSADVLKRPRLVEGAVALLMVGAFLRVGAELMGGYGGIAGPLVAGGGALSTAGFALFALGLWASLGRLPRALAA